MDFLSLYKKNCISIVFLVTIIFQTVSCSLECIEVPDRPCDRTFKIGYPIMSNHSIYEYYVLRGFDIFFDWADKQSFCIKEGGEEVRFCFTRPTCCVDADSRTFLDEYQDLALDPNTFLFADFDLTGKYAKVFTEPLERLLIATYATSHEFYNTSKHAFSTVPAFSVGISNIIPVYRLAGANSAILLKADLEIENIGDIELAELKDICDGLDAQLNRSYFSSIKTIKFHPYGKFEDDYVNKTATEIIEEDADLIIYCGNVGHVLEAILKKLRIYNYMPRGIISGGTREFKYDRDLANYITHVSLKISPDGGYPPAKCIESMEVYDKMFIERFPDDYFDDPIYMLGYASVNAACMLLNAIEISNSFDEAKLTHTIRTEVFKSLIGEIRYDSRNGNLNEGVAVQIVGNRDNIFSPAIFSNASLIYPAPTWDERVEVSKYHATEIAINIIVPIFILNSLGWAIYIIIFRKERKIIASSPIFLICMLIGKC